MIGAEALPSWCDSLLQAARSSGEDTGAAIAVAREHGVALPLPGRDTATRWSVLSAVAEVNLTTARVLEAHTDALAILAEAGQPVSGGSAWGVFAAEAPHARLDAVVADDGSAVLDGTKPWCSLGGQLDAALVTAHTADGRQLFRVDLHDSSVTAEPGDVWVARGLRTVTSGPVRFEQTPATSVGSPGWYLDRPGFARGGLGVAACWYGGALGVAAAVRRRAETGDNDILLMHLGAVDVALHGAATALADAAQLVDAPQRCDEELLALRVRSVVADAAERVLRSAAHALGPAPLAFDAEHAARVADLEIYVRQHHAERDLAALGRRLVGMPS